MTEIAPPQAEQIVIAARPCDAAMGPILDHVFNWDYADAAYNRRRELTTVVTLACRSFDAQCFCTSVGSGPDDPRGSDVMLYALDEGILEIRCLTEKGRRLFAGHTEPSERTAPVSAGPERRFDLDKVGAVPGKRFRRPAVAGPGPAMSGLRGLRLHLPDLPLLRHRRRRGRRTRRAGPELGRLPVRPVHAARRRATTRGASRPSGSGSGFTTSFASIRRNSARCSAPAAATARGIAPSGSASARCFRRFRGWAQQAGKPKSACEIPHNVLEHRMTETVSICSVFLVDSHSVPLSPC